MNIFRHLFGVFLHSRRNSHLFRRLAIFESLPAAGFSREVPDLLAGRLLQGAREAPSALLARLGAREVGLSTGEADAVHRDPLLSGAALE